MALGIHQKAHKIKIIIPQWKTKHEWQKKKGRECAISSLSSSKKYSQILQGGFHSLNGLGHRPTCIWSACLPRQTWCQKIHDVSLHKSSSVFSMRYRNTTSASDFILQFPERILRLYFCSYCLLHFRQHDSLSLAVTLGFITSGLCCITLLALCTHLLWPQCIIRCWSYSFIRYVQFTKGLLYLNNNSKLLQCK